MNQPTSPAPPRTVLFHKIPLRYLPFNAQVTGPGGPSFFAQSGDESALPQTPAVIHTPQRMHAPKAMLAYKKLYCTLSLLLVAAQCLANPDSLWTAWQNQKAHDTLRLSALDLYLGHDHFFARQPDSAVVLVDAMYTFAEKANSEKYVARSHSIKGLIHHQKGAHEAAQSNFRAALALYETLGDAEATAETLNRLGVSFKNMGDFETARQQYLQSLDIFKSTSDSAGCARTVGNIAVVEMSLGRYEASLRLFDQALEYLREGQHPDIRATFYNNMGLIFLETGRLDSAQHFLSLGVASRRELKDEKNLAGPLYNLGYVAYLRGNYDEALKYAQEAYDLFLMFGNNAAAAQVLNFNANILRERGNYTAAIALHREALKHREQHNDLPGMAQSLTNIGLLYFDQKDYPQALKFCRKGMSMFEKLGVLPEVAAALSSMGSVHLNAGNLDSATTYFERSLAIRVDIGDQQGQAVCLNNLGEIAFQQNRLEDAIALSGQSLRIREEIGNKQSTAAPMNNLAKAHFALKDYKKAAHWASNALAAAGAHGTLIEKSEAARLSYLALKALGKPLEAFPMYEMHVQLRDSIAAEENTKELTRFEFQYEYEKKSLADSLRTLAEKEALAYNHQITVAQKEKERNLYASGGLMLALLLGLFYQRKVNRGKLLLQQREAAYQSELLQATIESQETERKRIARDLHDDVGAMLSAIKFNVAGIGRKLEREAQVPDPTEPAVQLIDDTIGNLRQISQDLMPPSLEQLGLVPALEELADKVRKATGLEVHTHFETHPERLSPNRELALYRAVQELFNNALKHSGARTIRLGLHQKGNAMELHFEDDGKGFDYEALRTSKSKGLGLKNIENRTRMAHAGLRYASRPGKGTQVAIVFEAAGQGLAA